LFLINIFLKETLKRSISNFRSIAFTFGVVKVIIIYSYFFSVCIAVIIVASMKASLRAFLQEQIGQNRFLQAFEPTNFLCSLFSVVINWLKVEHSLNNSKPPSLNLFFIKSSMIKFLFFFG